MGRELPSGTVTFLFTDVEGSTKLLHDLGAEAYAEALAEHRRVIREACAAEGGAEVDTQGDAFFFAFPTAPGALRAARAFTEALEGGPIRVRVGLHTGTPIVTDEGYVGDDVHLAARIGAAGHGGQVLTSSATASLVELELTDLGDHRFKDLSAPERVFQLGGGDFPRLKTLHQTNLPIPSTPFLGRERELAEVLGLLSRDEIRLLTLTGPGGTGKTRLAAQAAGAVSERYPHGVWWVPLAALRDSELVLDSASQALGARNGIASHIGDQRLLLLFDNFEHVVEAAASLAPLLAECAHLTLLVTSREPLHLAAEQEYAVPPLADADAVEFFAAKARATEPRFDVDEAVPAICRRLDLLPLALELAAARVKALTPAQILARLEQRLPLLTGGTRDAPARQRTLQATIEWSYGLLTSNEQRLFARLSVFAGGSTLEAAAAVCDADLDMLQSLVDKSLVRFTDGRYWMLETIREYAAHCLDDSGEAPSLRSRHAGHFLALAAEAEPHLREAHYTDWLDRLDAELGNLRKAQIHVRATEDSAAELQLAASLERYWVMRGHLSEGRRALEQALAVAPEDLVELRLRALLGAAHLARLHGDNDSARSKSTEALELARDCRDLVRTGSALHTLASVAIDDDDLDLASQLLDESIAAVREANDDRALAIGTSTRAYIALTRGEHALAVALCEECLALGRAMENEEVIALAWLNLGAALLSLGEVDDALSAYVDGLRLSAELGSRVWVQYAQEGLAAISVARGDMDAGLQLAASAKAMREELDMSLDRAEQRIHESTLDAIRAALPEQVVTDAFEAARQLSPEEALALALASRD